MKAKYFDKDRIKIGKAPYLALLSLGESYSKLLECEFDNRVKLSLHWCGKFNVEVPDSHCSIFEIIIQNKTGTTWGKEPSEKDMFFFKKEEALLRFAALNKEFHDRYGNERDNIESHVLESDIDDFGEPEVPKDIPATKSKNMGCW